MTQKWSKGTNYAEHKWSPQTTYGWTIYVVTGQLYNYIVDQPNTSLIYGPLKMKKVLRVKHTFCEVGIYRKNIDFLLKVDFT